MAIYYGLIAKEGLVLSQFSIFPVDVSSTALMLLRNTTASISLKTYTHTSKVFSFYTHDSISYLCCADASAGIETTLQYLAEMKHEYLCCSKSAKFEDVIKKLLDKYSENKSYEIRVESELRFKVNNIDRVMLRGRQMTEIVEKANEMAAGKMRRPGKASSRPSKLQAMLLMIFIGAFFTYCFTLMIQPESSSE